MALAPLRQFGLKTSILTSLQAISGAGYRRAVVGHSRQRGPFIGGGEGEDRDRDEQDPRRVEGGAVENHPVTVSAR
jgi:aspartate-semialdehyde dehydrogenase